MVGDHWRAHPIVPYLRVKVSDTAAKGEELFDLHDTRDGVTVTRLGPEDVVLWVADRSRVNGKLPLGDWFAAITKQLGFKTCLTCYKRLTRWNNLL